MWHIELVKNKYESLEDLYSLLQYVFRLNKTADDSRRANIITDDLTGCLPAMIPDINNPDGLSVDAFYNSKKAQRYSATGKA